jgi:hypothetical protein
MPTTRNRVPSHTNEAVNREIERGMVTRVRYYDKHRDQIGKRLRELDEEWDIERAIEANASTLALVGIVLGTTRDSRWLVLPAVVAGFLFQHAIQGWCPPVPILRRLGFRTSYEIERERQALKALRGDFEGVSNGQDRAGTALAAAAL